MSLFDVRVSIINKFCDNFKDLFSSKEFAVFRMFIYAMLRDYEKLNNKRINTLRRQRTTGFAKEGVLVIDDTGSLKPYAKQTEGVSM